MKGAAVANYLTLAAEPQQADEELDWWMRLLRNNPHTRGNNFKDEIHISPPDEAARNLDFDKMSAHEHPVTQEWLRQNPEPNMLEYARRMMQSPQRMR